MSKNFHVSISNLLLTHLLCLRTTIVQHCLDQRAISGTHVDWLTLVIVLRRNMTETSELYPYKKLIVYKIKLKLNSTCLQLINCVNCCELKYITIKLHLSFYNFQIKQNLTKGYV